MACYEIVKDFAGPVATIFAASAAVFVTTHFNRKQVEISETQKNISLDKLKWDSHEERYKIYTQAKELISYVSQQHDFEKIDNQKVRDLRVIIDEARFFFGASVRSFLGEIDKTCESLLTNLGVRWQMHDDDNDEDWRNINASLGEDAKKLRALYADMPRQFESSLALSQLVRD